MLKLIKKLTATSAGKVIGYELYDEITHKVYKVSRDNTVKIAREGKIKDVTILQGSALKGLNGFKLTNVKQCTEANATFIDLDELSKKVKEARECKKKEPVKEEGIKVVKPMGKDIKILNFKIDEKLGKVKIATKCSPNTFYTTLNTVSTKNVPTKDGNMSFATYSKNWILKMHTLDLDAYTIVIHRSLLEKLRLGVAKAKTRRVKGVDVFNIVNADLHGDLLEIYDFLIKNALIIESTNAENVGQR